MSMTSNNAYRKRPPANFSDATIRRFLLGQLRGAEQASFEAELLTSDQLEERMRLHELVLADDYSFGLSTDAEADLIRQRFLLTQDRNQTVAVSRALNDRFTLAIKLKPSARWRAIFNLERSAWRYAFASVILLIVFAAVWLRVKEPQFVQQIVPPRFRPKPAPTQIPQLAHHPISSSVPTHVEETSPLPEHQVTFSIALDANNTVGNPLELKLSNLKIESDRVRIVLEEDQVGTYRAELWNSRGESLFTLESIATSDGGKLRFEIPVQLLSTGEYLFRLTPEEEEPARRTQQYYFRVSE